MTDTDLQKYWDACLIRSWRRAEQVIDTVHAWESITGKGIKDTPILRKPPASFPWKVGVRVFVAERLHKLSNYLWGHGPEKDVELLRKLQTSKYDTDKERAPRSNMVRELESAQNELKNNRAKMVLGYHNATERNHATDWNVVKGPRGRSMRTK
jgi:hypothetical protein